LQKVILDNPSLVETKNLQGATGQLYMNFRPKSPFAFRISLVEPLKVEYETKLPGCLATWYWHYDAVTDNEVELKMGVRMSGWLTWGYQFALGKDVAKAFDICTGNLKNLVETGSVEGKQV
jgi:hypothetical protein